jgi:hypothetical protein
MSGENPMTKTEWTSADYREASKRLAMGDILLPVSQVRSMLDFAANRIEADERVTIPDELFAWLTARDLVPDLNEDGSFDMHLLIEALNEHENELQATNPARSVVVSDEDCREFLCKMPLSAAHTPIEMVRAALEHFAAIAQEKQS